MAASLKMLTVLPPTVYVDSVWILECDYKLKYDIMRSMLMTLLEFFKQSYDEFLYSE